MHLHLDVSRGAAGDMLVGALLDLGVDFNVLKKTLSGLASVSAKKVKRQGLPATNFRGDYKKKSRQYTDLAKLLDNLEISNKSKKLAKKILKVLAEAEAKAHQVPLPKVHLHEAVDCVVDAAAFALALEKIQPERVTASILSIGDVAPATCAILERHQIPVRITSDQEITTPTGAAILAAAVDEWTTHKPEGKTGYGAGDRNFSHPNVVGAILHRPLAVLESNIDDVTPETVSYAQERLIDEGALDVHVLSAAMKKGRLGYLVRVLTDSPERHAQILMAETGSLGVRVLPVTKRFMQERSTETKKIWVSGKTESVRLKKSPVGAKPEFDDLRRIAKKHGKPLRELREEFTS